MATSGSSPVTDALMARQAGIHLSPAAPPPGAVPPPETGSSGVSESWGASVPEVILRMFGNDPAAVQKAYDAMLEGQSGRFQYGQGQVQQEPAGMFRSMIGRVLRRQPHSAQGEPQAPYSPQELATGDRFSNELFQRYIGQGT